MENTLLYKEVIGVVKTGINMIERIGDCANIEHRVKPKSALWQDIIKRKGWVVQKERLGNRARIIDDKCIQRGNGSLSTMIEKMERLLSDEFLRVGDIVGVSRGAYEHYGIYVGGGKIIHYAGKENDFTGAISIHEVSINEFIKNSKGYFVISFSGRYPVKMQSRTMFIANSAVGCYNCDRYNICSPEETVERAYSRLGEAKYNLISNNCEHFAMWCKTGISESIQVKQIARYIFESGKKLKEYGVAKGDTMLFLD